jgi:hypothetical protein
MLAIKLYGDCNELKRNEITVPYWYRNNTKRQDIASLSKLFQQEFLTAYF